jgi:hypothetical protein
VSDGRLPTLLTARLREPGAFARAAANRTAPPSLFNEHGNLLIIAADHPARGALRAGSRALAMGDRVDLATTLPALILGGEAGDDVDAVYESWRRALRLPTVQGLVIGRRLLYPPDDDVAAAVDIAAGLLRKDHSLV